MTVSYPPIDTSAYLDVDAVGGGRRTRPARAGARRLRPVPVAGDPGQGRPRPHRGLRQRRGRGDRVKLVDRGHRPGAGARSARWPAGDDRIVFLTDVDDDEKPLLMRGCATYALPTKPEPDFVETFGIALAEKMLAGGGPVITTLTGGTGEAVGDTAVIVEAGDVAGLRGRPGPGGAGDVRPRASGRSSGAAASTRWRSTGCGCSTTCSLRAWSRTPRR